MCVHMCDFIRVCISVKYLAWIDSDNSCPILAYCRQDYDAVPVFVQQLSSK